MHVRPLLLYAVFSPFAIENEDSKITTITTICFRGSRSPFTPRFESIPAPHREPLPRAARSPPSGALGRRALFCRRNVNIGGRCGLACNYPENIEEGRGAG